MFKFAVAALCGISLTGSVYMAGWGSQCADAGGDEASCCMPVAHTVAMADTPSADKAGLIDVKNTKCIVSGEDAMEGAKTVAYKGKLYHICCPDCEPTFNKDPEKYVKAFEADPAKFGVKK